MRQSKNLSPCEGAAQHWEDEEEADRRPTKALQSAMVVPQAAQLKQQML